MNVIEIALVCSSVLQAVALGILTAQHERTRSVLERMALFVATMAMTMEKEMETELVVTD